MTLQLLLEAHKQQAAVALHGLVLSSATDAALNKLAHSERLEALRLLQQLAPAIKEIADFAQLLDNLVAVVSAEQRRVLCAMSAPLMRNAEGQPNRRFVAMFTELCQIPADRRAVRMQVWLGVVLDIGVAQGANVHDGALRDTRARWAAKSLWDNPDVGAAARQPSVEDTFDAIEVLITSLHKQSNRMSQHLDVTNQDCQAHLQRARQTIEALRRRPGELTLDIANRRIVSLAALVAMAYNLIGAVCEDTETRTLATRQGVQRLFVQALSESLATNSDLTKGAQGVVQRVLTPLQGYIAEIRLDDALEPPSENHFVLSFAHALHRGLKQASPDADPKAIAHKEKTAALVRASDVYLPAHNKLKPNAAALETRGQQIIAKIKADIEAYFEHERFA